MGLFGVRSWKLILFDHLVQPHSDYIEVMTLTAHICRVLGTPNEEIWPGVGQLPDYKPTFPHWSPQDLADHVPSLDDDGIDLLRVSSICFATRWWHFGLYRRADASLLLADVDLRHRETHLRYDCIHLLFVRH